MIHWSVILDRSIAPLALMSIVVAACTGGNGAAPTAPATTEAPEATDGTTETPGGAQIGSPEQADLVVALPFLDAGMAQRYFIATEEGFLDEAGLNVEVIEAEDVRAAVVSGSADVGIIGAGSAMDAVERGLGITIIAGHHCRSQYSFAVQPEVDDVTDLAGKDVILAGSAGDPAGFERKRVLAEEGWDVDEVGVNEVVAGYGVALESFLAGRVALMYYFFDDTVQLEEYGANFIVSELRAWPNDVYIAREGWVEENPNTAAHFLRAVMRSIEFMIAPAQGQPPENQEQILEYWRQAGFADEAEDVEALGDHPYAMGSLEAVCANLYYDMEAWETSIEVGNMDITVPFEEATNLDALLVAQEAMGLDNSPPPEIPWPPPAD